MSPGIFTENFEPRQRRLWVLCTAWYCGWVGGGCAYTGGKGRSLIKETGGGGMSAFIGSGHSGGCRLTTASRPRRRQSLPQLLLAGEPFRLVLPSTFI
jgi:hypothetical protein